jgi:glycosyltransferase involved in cell wall biosynthesis
MTSSRKDGRPEVHPVKVVYVLPGLGRGGTEKHVCDLAERIDRDRFSPVVVSTAGGGPMERTFRERDIPVHVLEYRGISLHPKRAHPLFRDACVFFRRFLEILRDQRVRIVHSYLPGGNLLGTFVGMLARVPARIVSKRALCDYKAGHPVVTFLEDLANLASDAVMVNSMAVATDVRRTERFAGRKIFLVYNGVDLDERKPRPIADLFPEISGQGEIQAIACVANLFPYKGHRDLIEAARIVVESYPSARFLLVGEDRGEMGSLRSMIVSRGLGEHVLLAGPRTDASAIVAASDLVVLPSHEEGFPNSILEGMAAGKAVVATNVGGIPEAVADGETGILVPPRDPAALAKALLSLLTNPDRARRMGTAGRGRVTAMFTIDRMISSVERAYEALLANNAGKRPAS